MELDHDISSVLRGLGDSSVGDSYMGFNDSSSEWGGDDLSLEGGEWVDDDISMGFSDNPFVGFDDSSTIAESTTARVLEGGDWVDNDDTSMGFSDDPFVGFEDFSTIAESTTTTRVSDFGGFTRDCVALCWVGEDLGLEFWGFVLMFPSWRV